MLLRKSENKFQKHAFFDFWNKEKWNKLENYALQIDLKHKYLLLLFLKDSFSNDIKNDK